jgi:hypothetical protein
MRRLERAESDPVRHAQLVDLVRRALDELRRRVGPGVTLAELAVEHARADDWVRELVRDALPPKPRVGVADATLVQDAAFAVYARGAIDWRP